MMKRIVTKIGDIFCVKIDDKRKRYFQYIANDIYQLNSSTIRVFKTVYPLEVEPDMEDIVADEVDFYSHTVLKFGIQENAWTQVGKSKNVGSFDSIMFRSATDYSSSCLKSYHWYVWKLGQEDAYHIGELTEEYANITDYGAVYPYNWLVEKIKTGHYPCAMPY